MNFLLELTNFILFLNIPHFHLLITPKSRMELQYFYSLNFYEVNYI
jgi:hypothetical protein